MFADRLSGTRRALAIAALFLTGCTRYSYDVEMSLTDSGEVRRRVSVRAPEHVLPGDVGKELTARYGTEAASVSAKEVAIEGRFQKSLPQDVGGHGQVIRQKSLLGEVVTYRERFRGSYDVQAQLAQRYAALNRACELWGEWAEMVAATPEAGRELRAFANGPLKTDVANALLVGTLTLAHNSTAPLEDQPEVAQQLIQFGIEQGYLTQEMLARLKRPGSGDHNGTQFWITMLDLKRSTSGLPSLRSLLPPLQSEAALRDSLNAFLRSTPEYRATDGSGEPIGILGELMLRTIGNPVRTHDSLTVTFQESTPPVLTNGEWIAQDQTIVWEANLEIPGEPPILLLPRLCYAVWSQSDEAFQRQHFGKVLVTGELLVDFVAWQEMLLDVERSQWDEFLVALRPEDNLHERLGNFAFRSESVPVEVRDALAQQVRQLFLRATTESEAAAGGSGH